MAQKLDIGAIAKILGEQKARIEAIDKQMETLETERKEITDQLELMGVRFAGTSKVGRPPMTEEQKKEAAARREAEKAKTDEQKKVLAVLVAPEPITQLNTAQVA